MMRSGSPKFRKVFYQILCGQRIILKSVDRRLQQQNLENSRKVAAANGAIKTLMQEYSKGPSIETATESTPTLAQPPDIVVETGTNSQGNGSRPPSQEQAMRKPRPVPAVTAFQLALNSGSVLEARSAKRTVTETQGGGKGVMAQTGKFTTHKPNNGKLPPERLPKKRRGDDDSSPGYVPGDSSSAEESPVVRRKSQRTKTDDDDAGEDGSSSDDEKSEQGRSDDASTSSSSNENGKKWQKKMNTEDSTNGGGAAGGVLDSDDSTSRCQIGSPRKRQKQVSFEVVKQKPAARTSTQVPKLSADGHQELSPSFIEPSDENTEDNTTDYTLSGDDDNRTDIGTQFDLVDAGVVVDTDDADEDYVSDGELEEGDPRKVVPISKRGKYYKAMQDQHMKPFYRIRRFDPHEQGCYLTLGNPPNNFSLSASLRAFAEDEANHVFESYEPFTDKSVARDVKFKEKYWSEKEGRRLKHRLGQVGVPVAEAMHKYTTSVLTSLLKTATLGSTFYEMVNQCPFGTTKSVSMMLRSQAEPYRTTFTAAFSHAKYLYDTYFETPMPKNMQRKVVMEVIFRTKSIRKSRVNSHKVDDKGVKVELEKRKSRCSKKDAVDFD